MIPSPFGLLRESLLEFGGRRRSGRGLDKLAAGRDADVNASLVSLRRREDRRTTSEGEGMPGKPYLPPSLPMARRRVK